MVPTTNDERANKQTNKQLQQILTLASFQMQEQRVISYTLQRVQLISRNKGTKEHQDKVINSFEQDLAGPRFLKAV